MAKTEPMDTETYRRHLRGHTAEESALLEASLKRDGCLDPLVCGILEGERYLIDGFHRKAICDRLGIGYAVNEILFNTEGELLSWVESHARGRRNQTRTDRNYDIGRQYAREKQEHGGQKPGKKRDGQKVPIDSTADIVAAKHRCSPKHVKNCHKFAQHLDEVCRPKGGMEWLRDLILREEVKYSPKLLERLNDMGSGGCKTIIEEWLEANPGKAVTMKVIDEAVGREEQEESEDDSDSDGEKKEASKKKLPVLPFDGDSVEMAVSGFMNQLLNASQEIPHEKMASVLNSVRLYVMAIEKRLQSRKA